MINLVVCLGYNPKDDGIILPILEARLEYSIKLCRENAGSTLFLMGGNTFRNTNKDAPDQSLLMKKYVDDHGSDILDNTKIIPERSATSTVRELCFIREFINKDNEVFKINIVASEFFVKRVELYSEYIFPDTIDINFVASKVPDTESESLQEVEEYKLIKGREWLEGHIKGDYSKILQEQEAFEKKIVNGEVSHPVSK